MKLAAAVIVMLGIPLLVAWRFQPADPAGPCVIANGPAMLPRVPEASGLAVSRRNAGVLWSHNDSGNATVLFAFDTAGTMLGSVLVPIRTRDWEDISAARCGSNDCLYLADIGNNRGARQRVQIYRLPEPEPGDAQTAAPEVFNATYADGLHDAEAMFVVGADLFIVTKDRLGGVYRSTPSGSHDLMFRRIGQLGLGAVTDAETSRDGKSVVVRTSREAVLYRTDDLIRGGNVPYFRIAIAGLREPQGEGVALDGNMLHLSSEGSPMNRAGRVVSLRCNLPQ
jgi:hypothetical protein